MSRTTHFYLARELTIYADKLAVHKDPMVRDASSLRCVRDAGRILVEQDEQIAHLTEALRLAREGRRARPE